MPRKYTKKDEAQIKAELVESERNFVVDWVVYDGRLIRRFRHKSTTG